MGEFSIRTLEKVEKLKKLIKKNYHIENGVSKIIGKKRADNDKLFNTLNELKEWLSKKNLYLQFTDEELLFLKFDKKEVLDYDILDENDLKSVQQNNKNEFLEKLPKYNSFSLENIFGSNEQVRTEKLHKFVYFLEHIDKFTDLIDNNFDKLNLNKEVFKMDKEFIDMNGSPASVRINKNILSKFYQFADKYKGYPKYAFFNMALKEFLLKYNK